MHCSTDSVHAYVYSELLMLKTLADMIVHIVLPWREFRATSSLAPTASPFPEVTRTTSIWAMACRSNASRKHLHCCLRVPSTFTGAGGRDLKGTKTNRKNVSLKRRRVFMWTHSFPSATNGPSELRPVVRAQLECCSQTIYRDQEARPSNQRV